MAFIGELTMEYCDVETRGVAREEIVAALHSTTPRDDDWYLTLTRANGEYFDALVKDGGGFEIVCSEGGKKMMSAGAIDEALLETMALAFYDHVPGWRGETQWKDLEKKKGLLGWGK